MRPTLVADVTLAACIYLSCLMVGAGLFASFTELPRCLSDPPKSFVTLQDLYGKRHVYFWATLHMCVTAAYPLALWANWRVPGRRKLLALVTALYLAERIWSHSFFIPQMMSFYKVAVDGPSDIKLTVKTIAWRRWNWLRVAIDALEPVLLMAAMIVYPATRATVTAAPAAAKVEEKRE